MSPANAPSRLATRVVKKLEPEDPGARRWAKQYGDKLVCVRYRIDGRTQMRKTTVELVVDEAPTMASVLVGVKIDFAEAELRERARAAGGRWDSMTRLWAMPLGTARLLGLQDRIVNAASR